MRGVPGKGAALNAISNHWFKSFSENGLADSHILDIPHPFVWIVQKAKPVMIEAICRQYITGSMWRSYEKGEREFCGIEIAEGLSKDSKLPELLQTPSTKGILTDIPGVPAVDDVNITRKNIEDNYEAFNFKSLDDITLYEKLLTEGFDMISNELAKLDHGAQNQANGLFTLFRIWLRKQFRLLGSGTNADQLAMHLLGRSQGVATMANAFQDEKLIRQEVKQMYDWLASRTQRPA